MIILVEFKECLWIGVNIKEKWEYLMGWFVSRLFSG